MVRKTGRILLAIVLSLGVVFQFDLGRVDADDNESAEEEQLETDQAEQNDDISPDMVQETSEDLSENPDSQITAGTEEQDQTVTTDELSDDESDQTDVSNDSDTTEKTVTGGTAFHVSDEQGMHAEVTAAPEAGIPSDAQLHADRIVPGTDEYTQIANEIKAQTVSEFGENAQVDYILYNFYFTSDSIDGTIEPQNNQLLNVEITYDEPASFDNQTEEDSSDSELRLVHVKNDNEVQIQEADITQNEAGEINSARFSLDSFSPIGFIRVLNSESAENGKEYSLTGSESSWIEEDKTSLLVEQEDESGNSSMVSVTDISEIPENAKYKLTITYKVPDNVSLTSDDTIVCDVPEWVGSINPSSGKLILSGKAESAGTWRYDAGTRKIIQQYSEDALEKYGRSDMEGQLVLDGIINTSSATSTSEKINLKFFDIGKDDITVKQRIYKLANVGIYKENGNPIHRGGDNNAEIESVPYTITVYAGVLQTDSDQPDASAAKNTVDLTNVTIDDAFTVEEQFHRVSDAAWHDITSEANNNNWITYSDIQGKVYDGSGNVVGNRQISAVNNQAGNAEFKLVDAAGNPASLRPDEKIVITYNAVISDAFYKQDPHGYGDKEITYPHTGDQNNSDPSTAVDQKTSDRSWVSRRAYNTAKVTADNAATPSTFVRKYMKGQETNETYVITADKTWLWTNGNPLKNYTSEYKIAVNEAPKINITNWTLTDDLSKYNQEIVSDIVIKYDGWNGVPVAVLKLDDLKNNRNLDIENVGTFEGSNVNKIQFRFYTDNNYDFIFKAKYKGTETVNNAVTSKNGAVLTDDTASHTYGVYESHSTKAATVTKRLVGANIAENIISWQTTIDKGIGAENGSVYRDFIGWRKGDEQSDLLGYKKVITDSERANARNPVPDHHFDAQKIGLKILYNENPDNNKQYQILTAGTDYDFQILTDTTWESEKTSIEYESDRFRENYFSACFQITFEKDLPGQILIQYDSTADFIHSVDGEIFNNTFKYWKTASKYTGKEFAEYSDTADYTYTTNGTISQSCVHNDSDGIQWEIRVNESRNTASQLEIRDTIPDGLDFSLTKDSFEFTEAWLAGNEGGNTVEAYRNAWNKAWDNNSGVKADGTVTTVSGTLSDGLTGSFKVSYDSSTRMLRVLLSGDINKKLVVYKFRTQPALTELENLQNGIKTQLDFNNSAEVFSNEISTEPLGTAAASCSITDKLLTKEDPVYNSPFATYTIKINPTKTKLSDSGKVTLKDTWTEQRMILMPDSIKANGAPISDNSNYQLRINKDNKGFELDLPDRQTFTVTYDVYIVGTTGDLQLSNNAQIIADKKELVTVTNNKTQSLAVLGSTTNMPNNIKIEKRDSLDTEKKLKGAEFAICPIDIDSKGIITNKGTSIGTVVTNDNGIASTVDENWKDGSHHEIVTSTIYGIYEIKAPSGYQLPEDAETVPVAKFVFSNGKDGIDAVDYLKKNITVIYVNTEGFTFTAYDQRAQFNRSIRGTIWLDVDKDGRLNNEDSLLKNIEVKLYKEGNSEVYKTVRTNDEGIYTFDNIEPGKYEIEFTEDRKTTSKSETAGSDVSIANADHKITDIYMPDDFEIENSTAYPVINRIYTLQYQNMGVIENNSNGYPSAPDQPDTPNEPDKGPEDHPEKPGVNNDEPSVDPDLPSDANPTVPDNAAPEETGNIKDNAVVSGNSTAVPARSAVENGHKESEKNVVPQTGDHTNLPAVGGMLVISVLAAAIVLVLKKKMD